MDRFIALFVGMPLGFVIMIYRFQITQITGKIQWAEEKIGVGGTFTLYILIGLAVSFFSLAYALGTVQEFSKTFFSPFFGVG